MTFSDWGPLNQMGCLESNGSDALGLMAEVTVVSAVSEGPQRGTRPRLVLMWPRTAWSLAAVGALPRAAEAQTSPLLLPAE